MLPILKKESILFDFEARSKQEVLEGMSKVFETEGYLCDSEQFLQDVLAREDVFSTYIDFGIGLPHGKSEGVESAGLCIARLQNPVVWDEETGDQADMVIMIAVKNESDNNLHLQILSRLSRLLMHEDFRDELKNGDQDQVYQVLLERLEVQA